MNYHEDNRYNKLLKEIADSYSDDIDKTIPMLLFNKNGSYIIIDCTFKEEYIKFSSYGAEAILDFFNDGMYGGMIHIEDDKYGEVKMELYYIKIDPSLEITMSDNYNVINGYLDILADESGKWCSIINDKIYREEGEQY